MEKKKMIFNIIALMIGALILIAGLYYLIKEKQDRDSRRIYGISSGAGIIIVVGVVIKMLTEML